jgi:hypothetical protein
MIINDNFTSNSCGNNVLTEYYYDKVRRHLKGDYFPPKNSEDLIGYVAGEGEEGEGENNGPQLLDYLFTDGTFGSEIGDKVPVGICVAPASHFADGKARFMSLKEMSASDTAGTTEHTSLGWGTANTDAGLTKYSSVAVVDSEGALKGVNQNYGFIPSKRAEWSSASQPAARPVEGVYYAGNMDPNNPSPYPFLADGSLNPDYSATEFDGSPIVNMLSDVNGAANTTTLVGLGSDYVAANACHNFAPGVHDGEWYLPAIGELGYMIALYDDINAKITAAGEGNGVVVAPSNFYWSSTGVSESGACNLRMNNGYVGNLDKTGTPYVRAFLAL